MLQPTCQPVMAPAATNMGSQESMTVRPIQTGPSRRSLAAAIQGPIMKGASRGLTSTSPSAQSFPRTAPSPAQPRARAERAPRPPTAWSARRVSAAAMPLGKRSCSMLIICRFMGMAMVTPSTERKKIHASITGSERARSLISM
jgi:hypothetical protein